MLEGRLSTIEQLFERICGDPRHHHIQRLAQGSLVSRNFPAWSMEVNNLSAEPTNSLPILDQQTDGFQVLLELLASVLQQRYLKENIPTTSEQAIEADNHEFNDLTTREQEVLNLVARGLSTKAIASTLMISDKTVNRHIENIKHKTHSHSKNDLIEKIYANGYVLNIINR